VAPDVGKVFARASMLRETDGAASAQTAQSGDRLDVGDGSGHVALGAVPRTARGLASFLRDQELHERARVVVGDQSRPSRTQSAAVWPLPPFSRTGLGVGKRELPPP
jgi:hypothetical protein